jgi:hypothetical protein
VLKNINQLSRRYQRPQARLGLLGGQVQIAHQPPEKLVGSAASSTDLV